jgi:hypothetical protein
VATINDKSMTDRKTETTPKSHGESDYEAPRASDDTRTFIETHAVTKLARKAAAGSGEESADLLQTDPSHANRDESSKSK